MIPISEPLRPCMVNNEKALFHGWYYLTEVIAPSMMVGGHNGGQVTRTFGIIERENGDVQLCNVTDIKFVDKKMEEFYYPNDEKRLEE